MIGKNKENKRIEKKIKGKKRKNLPKVPSLAF